MLQKEQVAVRLGVAFGILLVLTIAVGWLALGQMDRNSDRLQQIQAKDWNMLILTQEALRYSNANSRITVQMFLLENNEQVPGLLLTRAANTRKIGELLDRIEGECDTEEEKRLLAAFERPGSPMWRTIRGPCICCWTKETAP
jgi:hypothetical protein